MRLGPVATWCRKFMEMVARDVTARAAGKRCLILAPHPDDEVLGCGGTIARKIRGGSGRYHRLPTAGVASRVLRSRWSPRSPPSMSDHVRTIIEVSAEAMAPAPAAVVR